MRINQVFKITKILYTDKFQRVFNKFNLVETNGDEYVDLSLAEKGITILYCNSQYKKKVSLIVNSGLILRGKEIDVQKLIRKLEKRITKYFDGEFSLEDFTVTELTLTADINVGSRDNVSYYIRVLQRIGKVKRFSPASYDSIDEKTSFCLNGNSNNIDFLLYDLESAVLGQLRSGNAGRKKLESASMQTKGILRTEIRLTKPKAIRVYTDAENIPGQIVELSKNRQQIFLDTFARIVPYGDFYKKDAAVEIILSQVKDSIMRRKMLRLLALIPEKKSLRLAQKAMNCRDVEKVMESFAKINLSPVTISKRQDVKYLESLYLYF